MSKISPQDKIYYCQQYQQGKISKKQIARETGLATSSIHQWLKNYASMGSEAFTQKGNKHYPKELKLQAVEDFLAGTDSQYEICKKYV